LSEGLEARLRRHVAMPAGEIGERHVRRPRARVAGEAYIAGDLASMGHRVRRQTYEAEGVPSSSLEIEIPGATAASEIVPHAAWSDQISFWKQGYRAVMVTDTAFYRHRHYHQASDTAERLDCAHMAEVVSGLAGALARLVGIQTKQGGGDG
jgi:hypothetical protein